MTQNSEHYPYIFEPSEIHHFEAERNQTRIYKTIDEIFFNIERIRDSFLKGSLKPLRNNEFFDMVANSDSDSSNSDSSDSDMVANSDSDSSDSNSSDSDMVANSDSDSLEGKYFNKIVEIQKEIISIEMQRLFAEFRESVVVEIQRILKEVEELRKSSGLRKSGIVVGQRCPVVKKYFKDGSEMSDSDVERLSRLSRLFPGSWTESDDEFLSRVPYKYRSEQLISNMESRWLYRD